MTKRFRMIAGPNGNRRDELNRKACGWLTRGGIAAVGNSSMGSEPMEAMNRITSTISQGNSLELARALQMDFSPDLNPVDDTRANQVEALNAE